jgi:glutathione S-transferase
MPPMIVWGPELSPFLLKLEAMLAFAGARWRRLPRDGSRLENLRTALTIRRAVRGRTALRPPANDPLDEYPLVPFLLHGGSVLYDSTAIAGWLDREQPGAAGRTLVPAEPATAFVAALIDEAFDEFGLSMVHHNRWKLAATDNGDPGARLAREYARFLPPGVARPFAHWFARRQVRRLPYLFSVAPPGDCVDGLAASLTPPSRAGFPPTHELLEESWRRYLLALETILVTRRFLLGPAFTVADASAYGQLSMNLTDPLAARRLKEIAPRTHDWLIEIRSGGHVGSGGEPILDDSLRPLLDVIFETFVPLMVANAQAVARLLAGGERLFNERAFDRGRSLYDGEILGRPFRSVAKTFQARSWRDLCEAWSRMDEPARARVARMLPDRQFDHAFAAVRFPR